MSIQATVRGYICDRCDQVVTIITDFQTTMEAHACPKYVVQLVKPEKPVVLNHGRGNSVATAAERRNAKPGAHQQLVLPTPKSHESVRKYRGRE